MKQAPSKNLISVLLLLLIIGIAAWFRLVIVTDNPGWFTDEGTHIEVARSMLEGKTQYLAVKDSILLFSRVPFFGRLLAEVGRLFGLNMTTLRLLTGSLGVMSVGLLAVLTWRMTGKRWLTLTAAFILTIFPAAIAFNRMGFSYNLLAPLLLVVCLGLWEYDQHGSKPWLAIAALSIGLGTISDLWMISYLPVMALLVLFGSEIKLNRFDWRNLVWSLPLALLPLATYILQSLLAAPEAFLFDVAFVRARLSMGLWEQVQSLATNITVLLSQDGWIALGFVGLLALPRREQRRFMLVFVLVPLAILGRSTALHGLGFHYFIPFLPFIGLGIGALIYRGVPILAGAIPFNNEVYGRGLAVVLVSVPLATTIWLVTGQVDGRFQTAIDPFLVEAVEAEAVADFINGELGPDDLVIATPTTTWMLNTNRADFQMSVVASGITTPHLPAGLPPERYAFNPDYHNADMIVVDKWWYTWGQFNVPGLTEMIEEVTDWPVVFESGDMVVYQNPGGVESLQ